MNNWHMVKQGLIKPWCGLASDTDSCVILDKGYPPTPDFQFACLWNQKIRQNHLAEIRSSSRVLGLRVFPPGQCSGQWGFQLAAALSVQPCRCLVYTELHSVPPSFAPSMPWHWRQEQVWPIGQKSLLMIPSVTNYYPSGHAGQRNDVSKGRTFAVFLTVSYHACQMAWTERGDLGGQLGLKH